MRLTLSKMYVILYYAALSNKAHGNILDYMRYDEVISIYVNSNDINKYQIT